MSSWSVVVLRSIQSDLKEGDDISAVPSLATYSFCHVCSRMSVVHLQLSLLPHIGNLQHHISKTLHFLVAMRNLIGLARLFIDVHMQCQ